MGVASADVRDEEPGGDRVDGDSECRELEREAVREVLRTGLRCHVGRADRRLDLVRRKRRRHDDPPEPAGTHVAGGGTRGREDAVEVDVDDSVPALVRVVLERTILSAGSLAADPGTDEADTRIDPGVRERDVEPAVGLRRVVDRPIEGGVIGHVGDGRPHVEPFALEPGGLLLGRAGVDVDQRHSCAVRREHLAVGKPEAAGSAGDDHAEPGHVELRGNVHAPSPVISLTGRASVARPRPERYATRSRVAHSHGERRRRSHR